MRSRTIGDLSDEILVRIFSFLSAKEICRCSKVCSTWCRLANDYHLWKNLFIKKFNRFVNDPSFYSTVTPSQWKELYILKSNWFSGHCHVQSLHRKSIHHHVEPGLTKVISLKISKCGQNVLASINQDSKIVNVWSLEEKKGLHIVRCEGVITSLDFGCLRSRNVLAIGMKSNKFCLWDFKVARYLLHQRNLDQNALENLPILNLSTPVDLTDSAVMRVNLVDNKLATVTQDCIIRVWQLEFRFDGKVSCHCLHTLTTYKPRCSVLDIQLKQEAVNDSWSVSISHAAEVMENWNLIGFQSVKFQGVNLTNCTINIPESKQEIRSDISEKNTRYFQENQLESMSSRAFISCLSISPCTKLVTSGQNDNTISLWDTGTKMRKHTLFGHTGSVTCTDVDRHKIVSGSNDRTVKVWSLESGDCQLTLPEDHSSGVSCVTFNDQWVVSGDNSGEIKVWDFAVNSLSVLQNQEVHEN